MSDSQIIQQLNTLQKRVEDIYIPEQGRNLVAPFLDLPGRVGIWYAGNVQRSTGNIYDSGGQGRTLTYNGNPTINYTDTGIAYASLDETGDYFRRPDETDLDITGTETIPGNPGLTVYVWFRTADATPAGGGIFLSKWAVATGNRSYEIRLSATGAIEFLTSNNGTTANTATSSNTASDNIWSMTAGIMIPSNPQLIFLDKTWTVSAATPASIFAGNLLLAIGARSDTSVYFTGDISMVALYSQAHSQAMVSGIYQQTRSLYGVS